MNELTDNGNPAPAHTPGPWEAEVRGKLWDVCPTPRYPCQQPVASGHAGDVSERHQAMAVANARLLARAPAMAEALREILEECRDVPAGLSEAALGVIAIRAHNALREGGAI